MAREIRGELDIRGAITKLTVWVREGAEGAWNQEGKGVGNLLCLLKTNNSWKII